MSPTSKKPPAVPNPGKPRNPKLLIALAGAAAIVVALIVGAIVVSGGDSSDSAAGGADASSFLDGVPQAGAILGKSSAKVTLIQFEDPQCPICKRYQDEGFSDIVTEYVKTGKIKIRYAGLQFIGADSQKALLRVLAAAKQNKGFQFSEQLYARQGTENAGWVTDTLLAETASDLGLDDAKLEQDATSPAIAQEAAAMTAEATKLGVQGTPWFFIQIGDAAPYEVQPPSFAIDSFRPIFDDALNG
jgi:protein-disulfide isomerase